MPVKVLIIDDDQTLTDMYSERMSLEGFAVAVAPDGEKGLARVSDFQPDIILLDIMMPKISGFQVLEMLKSQKESAQIPVIILSALGTEENKEKGLSAGADMYIAKAETMPGQVVDAVKTLLKKKNHAK